MRRRLDPKEEVRQGFSYCYGMLYFSAVLLCLRQILVGAIWHALLLHMACFTSVVGAMRHALLLCLRLFNPRSSYGCLWLSRIFIIIIYSIMHSFVVVVLAGASTASRVQRFFYFLILMYMYVFIIHSYIHTYIHSFYL